MTRMVMCRKFKEELPGLERPPYPGPKGEAIFQDVSKRAWDDWQAHQTMLINRMRHGNMITPGQSLYVMEVAPAGYAALAANEAEKAANINILDVMTFGSFGRIYLGGEEQDIDVAFRAAEAAIEAVTGRASK